MNERAVVFLGVVVVVENSFVMMMMAKSGGIWSQKKIMKTRMGRTLSKWSSTCVEHLLAARSWWSE
jgi:hypothetical protein